ncbi:MAG: imidazole glycerol phosphate synthase subunit HisH [Pelagibacterales bacterium]|nr:imidazole glycerol phosphate synthase subunit HisH [Pelagibacterales bacterium]|tara:strand:- start:3568 stop:4188 length:621 start_codon:yes stop_codon:yes gene_type:complete
MTLKVGIIDYSICNLYSIERALRYVGHETYFVKSPKEIENIDALVLPGVGAFSTGIKNLKKINMDKGIVDYVKSGRPLLGICLGMQLLMSKSFEFGEHDGLNLVKGKVKKIEVNNNIPLPHVGWKHCDIIKNTKYKLFNHIEKNVDFYFTHSYACFPEDHADIFATFNYGQDLTGIIVKNNVIGCQFHPELSSFAGLELLKNINNI